MNSNIKYKLIRRLEFFCIFVFIKFIEISVNKKSFMRNNLLNDNITHTLKSNETLKNDTSLNNLGII